MPLMRSHLRPLTLIASLVVLAVGCGAPPGSDRVGSASGATPSITATIDHLGANGDTEPEPRGTLRLEGDPDRYLWLQALSTVEEHEAFADGEVSSSGTSIRRSYRRGDELRLVVADRSIAETDYLPFLFRLPGSDDDAAFMPVSPEQAGGLDFDPDVDPIEALPRGVALGTLVLDGQEHRFTTFDAAPGSLLGLLLDRRSWGESVWSGEVEPGRSVVLLESPEAAEVVVVLDADRPDAIVPHARAITDAVEAVR